MPKGIYIRTKNVWNKGLTKEIDERVNKNTRHMLINNPMNNPNTRKKLSEYRLGKKLSEETKIKMSLAHKGKYINKSWEDRYGIEIAKKMRERLSKIQKGRKLSKETRKKISEKKKGKTPKNINQIKGWNKGMLSGKYVKCEFCNKEKYIILSDYKRNLSKKFFCSLKHQYKYFVGERHKGWNGGISFEPYDIKFNKSFKKIIRKRDNQICMLCGIHREKLKRALDVHHINYNKKLTILENCLSLCRNCHMKTGFNRKYWIKFFQSLLEERYDYQYENNLPIINLEVIK